MRTVRRLEELSHRADVRRQRERVAVSHQKSVESRERGIVALTDDAVERTLLLVGRLIDELDNEAVEGIKVVAGDHGTGRKVLEMLDPLHVLDDQLPVLDKLIDDLMCLGKGHVRPYLLCQGLL